MALPQSRFMWRCHCFQSLFIFIMLNCYPNSEIRLFDILLLFGFTEKSRAFLGSILVPRAPFELARGRGDVCSEKGSGGERTNAIQFITAICCERGRRKAQTELLGIFKGSSIY